jgi:predicted ArsR family transcriptional regulator
MITEYKMLAGDKNEIINYYSFVDGSKYRWMVNASVEEQLDKLEEIGNSVGFVAYLENTSGENWKAIQDAVLLR